MPTEEIYGNAHFLLEVAGITPDQATIVGGFQKMSGMDSKTEVIEFKHGNDSVVRKKPGRTTYSDIVLTRGFTKDDSLWQWRKNIEDGIIDRRSGTITCLANDMNTINAQYNFYEGWPSAWKVPAVDADKSAAAVEELTISVEKTERVNGSGI